MTSSTIAQPMFTPGRAEEMTAAGLWGNRTGVEVQVLEHLRVYRNLKTSIGNTVKEVGKQSSVADITGMN